MTVNELKQSSRTERLGRQAFALGLVWVGYSMVRSATANQWSRAMDNAEEILRVQSALGFPTELAIQGALLDHTKIVMAANVYYLAAHFPVTLAFLAWAWLYNIRHRGRVVRTLVMATGGALVLHVAYPLAPPRFLDGFVDTAALHGPSPYSLGISGIANEIAAMPSMHVGWALLVAIGVSSTSKSRWRNVAFIHPAITTVVVIITANHYWLDVIIGAVLVLVAWQLTTVASASQWPGQSGDDQWPVAHRPVGTA